MLLRIFLLLTILTQTTFTFGQEQRLANTYHRDAFSLNGYWQYIVDPYENGYYNYRYEPFDQQSQPWASAFFLNSKPKDKTDLIEYDFDKMDSLSVPGDWNSQKENLFYYEGTVWYKKSFDFVKSNATNKVFLYFGAANYKAEVYFNGKKLGTHLGGFTPFQFEISDLIKDQENHLILKVDNKRVKEGVPTLNTDWWNYGGITRAVKIIETPETFISKYLIQLAPNDHSIIKGNIQITGTQNANREVTIKILELAIHQSMNTSDTGFGSFEISSSKIELWSPETPKLYQVEIIAGKDTITDLIGFRTIKTKGTDTLLNDKSIFLKGISIHEESPIRGGRANSMEDAEVLLGHAKSLGCNFVRLAHYPHNEHMIRAADKLGLLVWEEIPVYWTIEWDNEKTYDNAQNQIAEVIERDRNRASVIIWSMANETPTSAARNVFLNKLAKFTRAKDNSRLISAALEQKNYKDDPFTRTISDPFAEVVDILSFNRCLEFPVPLGQVC